MEKRSVARSAIRRNAEIDGCSGGVGGCVDQKFAPEVAGINNIRMAMLTKEQRQAEKTAHTAAKDAGMTAPKMRKAVDEARKLTEGPKLQMKDLRTKTAEVNGQLAEARKKFLPAEQQVMLSKPGHGRKGGWDGSGK